MGNFSRRVFILAGTAMLVAMLGPASATAAGSAKPDARIAYTARCCPYSEKPGKFNGTGIYNKTGLNQTVKMKYYGTEPEGIEFWATVRIKNTGTAAGSFKIKVSPGPNTWNIKYTIPFDDVTAEVEAGTFTTISVAPGDFTELYLEIDLDTRTEPSNRLITVTSLSNTTKKDAVKFKLVAGPACTC